MVILHLFIGVIMNGVDEAEEPSKSEEAQPAKRSKLRVVPKNVFEIRHEDEKQTRLITRNHRKKWQKSSDWCL